MMPAVPAPPVAASGSQPPSLLTRLWARPAVRAAALFLYYLGIIIALLLIYGRGDFTTAPFVYQGF